MGLVTGGFIGFIAGKVFGKNVSGYHVALFFLLSAGFLLKIRWDMRKEYYRKRVR